MNAVTNFKKQSLTEKFAGRYNIEPGKLMKILKATAFKVRNGEASNEQMASLLVVADQYNLNPFTKEIYAFPDKQNGIVPVVGVDGWLRIINDHPMLDGIKFEQSEEMTTMDGSKECPKWMDCIIYRKDRENPVVVREYLDEVYQGKRGNFNGPWQTHTKRMLRHKTLIQAARVAFSFSGIYDEDEAQRIVESNEPIDVTPQVVESVVTELPKEEAESDYLVSQQQAEMLLETMQEKGVSGDDLKENFGVVSPTDIELDQFQGVIEWLAGF